MKKLTYYYRIWWLMSKNSFMVTLSQKSVFLIFLISKFIRVSFFVLFLYFLLKETGTLAGYTLNQTIFFYLTYNVIDVIGQFLFRDVYRFRGKVVSGEFDLTLSKPASALYRSLMGGADIIDLATLPFLFGALIWVGSGLDPDAQQVFLYSVLAVNGLLIATAFHIAALALAIITLEIDHTVMIYRDLMALGRLPVGVYREPLRSVLTYVIPVATMITIPAQSLMGLLSFEGLFISLALGGAAIFISLKFWKFSLKYYTSASS